MFLSPADIEPCLDTELSEFPMRMRDWLKNVLVTLYERDEDNNLLTEKQKLRVRQQTHGRCEGTYRGRVLRTSGVTAEPGGWRHNVPLMETVYFKLEVAHEEERNSLRLRKRLCA